MTHLGATGSKARMFGTLVEVERALLAPLIPSALKPRRMYGSICGLSIQFFDIPESPVGPYRECTLSVLCKDEFDWPDQPPDTWRSLPGFAVWVAVTSEDARYYGREVWGYPKHVADVRFDLNGSSFEGSLTSKDASVRCAATITSDLEWRDVELRSLSSSDGDLLDAPMPGRARVATDWNPQASYRLQLDALGLGVIEGTSTAGIYADDFTFELLAPVRYPLSRFASSAIRK